MPGWLERRSGRSTAVSTISGTHRSALRPRLRLAVPAAARAAFLLASLAAFGAFAVMGIIAALGPSFAAHLLHRSNGAVGGLVVSLLLGCSAISQLTARRAGLARLFTAGPLLLVAGLGLIVSAQPSGAVAAFAAGAGLAGIGQGLCYVAGQRLLDARVDAADRSAVFSSFFVVLYVGTALGALGVGVLIAPLGVYPAIIVVSVAIAVLALATIATARRDPALTAA
jgi:MFS family permease